MKNIERKELYFLVMKIINNFKMEIACFLTLSSFIMLLCIYVPHLISKIIDLGIMNNNLQTTIKFVLLLIVIELLINLFQFVIEFVEFGMINKFKQNSEVEVFSKVLCLKMDYINSMGVNKIISDILLCVNQISELLTGSCTGFLLEIAKIIGYFIGIYSINNRLAVYVVIFLPLKIIVALFLRNSVGKSAEKLIFYQSELSQWKQDNFDIHSIFEIKMWGLKEVKEKEYREKLHVIRKELKRMFLRKSILYDGIESMQVTFINLFYYFGAVMIINKNLEIGQLVAFISYINLFLSPVDSIISVLVKVKEIYPAARKYIDFSKLEYEKNEQDGDILLEKIDTIEFKNVIYKVGERNILDNLSFSLSKGDRVALYGSNGSGKTSILKLISKIIEPTGGEIYINSIPYAKISYNIIRKNIAYMNQQPFLYNTSIEKNIKMYGKSLIKKRYEGLISFAINFKEKLDHRVGIYGSKISGGERQKVSLLRTLGKNSKVLILDEPDSEFDYYSKYIFEEILEDSDYDIIIAVLHEQDRMHLFNKVLYLEEGRVSEIDCIVDNK